MRYELRMVATANILASYTSEILLAANPERKKKKRERSQCPLLLVCIPSVFRYITDILLPTSSLLSITRG